jgi:hypothetical protein
MQSTIILVKGMRQPGILSIAGLMICLALGGCSKPKLPAGVLDDARFSDLLIDVYIAEAKVLPLRILKDSVLHIYQTWEDSMLIRKKISRKDLKETYRYYLDHPSDFERVYEIVMDSLNLREQRFLHAKIKGK